MSRPAALPLLLLFLSGAAAFAQNQPPVVSITEPDSGATIVGPTTITLEASASSSDSTIKSVTYYIGGGATKLATETVSPYKYNWPKVSAGSYSVTAVAKDALGLSSSPSAPVNITVTQDQLPAVTLSQPLPGSMLIGPASIPLSASVTPGSLPVVSVEFDNGTTKIGTLAAPPYVFTWKPVQAGNYSVTAKATDSLGMFTVSAPVSITVNQDQPATVTLAATPAPGFTGIGPENITLTASVTPGSEPVASVSFAQGATKLGTVTNAPYVFTWKNVAANTYSVTATATDTLKLPGTSAPLSVTVSPDPPPTVSITVPANGSTMVAGSTILLNASASSADETIKSVTYSWGTTKIGTSTKAATYPFSWKLVPASSYSLTAVAVDSLGTPGTSAPVNITVVPDQGPSVALITPISGATYVAPASIELSVSATPFAGTNIASVTYNNGATPIATVKAAPFAYDWKSVAAGTYSVTAVATDNVGGVATSAPVSITVASTTSTVKITAPTSGKTVAAPASVTITANATASARVASVSFYAGNTLIGTSTTSPYQYAWSNIPAGVYYLTAVETDTHGASVTSAPITFTAGVPPVVTLTAPAGGTIYPVPATINLAATVVDSAKITNVQFFYQGSTLIGSTTTSPYQFSWTSMPAGAYSLTVVATDATGLTGTSSPATVFVEPTLPYQTDFEIGDDFNVGPLAGQGDWMVPQGTANVSGTVAYLGSQSIQLAAGIPVAIAQVPFASSPGETVIFCDFYALPVAESAIASSTLFTAEQAEFGFQQVNGQGVLEVYTGNGTGAGTWTPTSFTIPLGSNNQAQNWVHLTARLDFTKETWDIYANGNMIAYDIPFISKTSTYFSTFQAQGDASTDSFVDHMYIGPNNPLFPDINNDGISDIWETQYDLSLSVNDRYLNISGDGVPIIQDFVNNTSPFINTKVTPPPVQSGLVLDLRADAGVVTNSNGNVTQWLDQSPLGNVASQSVTQTEPQLAQGQINGRPALTFNGSNTLTLPINMMQNATAGEIIGVVDVQNTPSQFGMLWNFGTGFGSSYFNNQHFDDFGSSDLTTNPENPAEISQYFIYDTSINAAGTAVYRYNGFPEWTRTGLTVGFQLIPDIGGYGNGSFVGGVAEVLVFNRTLTDAERTSLVSYLLTRYALPSIAVPAAPTDLLASALSSDTVDLSWTVAGLPMHTVTTIQREAGSGGFVQVAQVNDTSSYTDTGLSPGVSYTYQITIQSYVGTSGVSNSATVTTPANIADLPQNGLTLWLRSTVGTEGSGPLWNWADQSGVGNNAVPVNSSSPPQVVENQTNGLPVVRFNGPNALNLPQNMLSAAQAGQIIAIVKIPNNPNQFNTLWNFGTGSGTSYNSFGGSAHFDDFGTNDTSSVQEDPNEIAQYYVYDASIDSSGNFVYRYNGNPEWTKSGTGLTLGFQPVPDIGGYGGGNLVGDIAEIILYNRVLSPQDQSTVYAYLDNKYSLSAVPVSPNAPAITSALTATGQIGQPFEYAIAATNNPTSYGASNLPAGLSIDSMGNISGTPTGTSNSAVTTPVTLSATNASGTGSVILQLTINPTPAGTTITSPTSVSAQAGTLFTYQITSSGTASYSTSTLPTWLTLSANGVLSGTPPAAGSLTVTLTATNSSGSQSATLTINISGGFPVTNGLVLLFQGDTGIQTETINGTPTAVWQDQSGIGNNAVQSGTLNGVIQAPTAMTVSGFLNSHAAVHFSQSSKQFLNVPSLSIPNGGEMFAVFREPSAATRPTGEIPTLPGAWNFGNDGTFFNDSVGVVDDFLSEFQNFATAPVSFTGFNIYNAESAGTTWTNRLNGKVLSTQASNEYLASPSLTIGNTEFVTDGADGDIIYGSSYFDGDIAEFVVFNRTLTDRERYEVGQYLEAKYSLPNITAPVSPPNLQATALNGNQVCLTWTDAAATDGVFYTIEREDSSGNFDELAQINSTLYYVDSNLSPGRSYTYQLVSNSYAPGAGQISNVASATTLSATTSPIPSAGLQVWLRADEGVAAPGGPVVVWGDQSGLGNDAPVAAAANPPTLVSNDLNNLPAINFLPATANTGSHQTTTPACLSLPNLLPNAQAGEVFLVVRVPSSGGGGTFAFGQGGTDFGPQAIVDGFMRVTPLVANYPSGTNYSTFGLYDVSASTGEWTDWMNGSYLAGGLYETSLIEPTSVTDPSLTGSGTLGENGNVAFTGDVAEFIVYNRSLSDSERLTVGQYLTAKYALLGNASLATPSGVTAQVGPLGQVEVSWTGVTGAAAYSLSRSIDGGPWTAIAQVGADSQNNSYADIGAGLGTTISYAVQAIGYASESALSAPVSTPAPFAVDPTTGLPYWFESDEGGSPLPNPPSEPPPPPSGPAGTSPPAITLITPPNATLQ